MDTVRLARDVGDVSGLLPTGIKRLRDAPWALVQAIKTALVYLSWEDEVPQEDMPERSMWTDFERVNEHFDNVKRRRDREFGRGDDAQQNDAMRMLVHG